MKTIVTGASGFIGSFLVSELVRNGYQVAALGRKDYADIPKSKHFLLDGSQYIKSDLDNPEDLALKLRSAGFYGSDLKYFFHIAWGGNNKLSDLDISSQTRNIQRTSQTYEIASLLKADSYIFCGTMEEAFAYEYTKMDYKLSSKYNRHVVYSLAKISARHSLKLSYKYASPIILFGTNSHVMGPFDDKDSFLQVVISNTINGIDINMSSGEQLFDVINVKDCARAYLAIARKGIHGTSYWVGSGKPRKLKDYVTEILDEFPGINVNYGTAPYNDIV